VSCSDGPAGIQNCAKALLARSAAPKDAEVSDRMLIHEYERVA
jgi:hypothetical protein